MSSLLKRVTLLGSLSGKKPLLESCGQLTKRFQQEAGQRATTVWMRINNVTQWAGEGSLLPTAQQRAETSAQGHWLPAHMPRGVTQWAQVAAVHTVDRTHAEDPGAKRSAPLQQSVNKPILPPESRSRQSRSGHAVALMQSGSKGS